MWSVYSYADAPMRVRARFETMEDAVEWARQKFGPNAEVRSPLPDQHDPLVVAEAWLARLKGRLDNANDDVAGLRKELSWSERRRESLEAENEGLREKAKAAVQEPAR
jgi:hypothetical protein